MTYLLYRWAVCGRANLTAIGKSTEFMKSLPDNGEFEPIFTSFFRNVGGFCAVRQTARRTEQNLNRGGAAIHRGAEDLE